MNKTIALVAHDNRKPDLIQWVSCNYEILLQNKLICTGTTGKLVNKKLKEKTNSDEDFNITLLKSGPLGGDQQLGSLIVDNKIDIIIFLWDAMSIQPHDVDIKALLRLAVLYNVPMACNRSTADYLITSELFNSDEYKPIIKDYSVYLNRKT